MSCHPTIQSLTMGSNSIYCFVTFSSRYTSTYWTYEWRVQGVLIRRVRKRQKQWNVIDRITENGGNALKVFIVHDRHEKLCFFHCLQTTTRKSSKNRIATCPFRCDETSMCPERWQTSPKEPLWLLIQTHVTWDVQVGIWDVLGATPEL